VPRVVKRFVKSVPAGLWFALAGLGALLVMALAWSGLTALRTRRLKHQRNQLLEEVGLLQAALLPPVPADLQGVDVSVAYRPAEGPAAGGDFYDCFPLPGGKVGLLMGDMSGHGRQALAQTAHVRFTMRAYLEAGVEPRMAVRLAGEALDEKLEGDFVTVLAAVYDPGSGLLTYATAGHPPPLISAPEASEPLTSVASPPIGMALPTGLRQTAVSLPGGTIFCLYTDGVIDARIHGVGIGRSRLEALVGELDEHSDASSLLDHVAETTDWQPDDMAACLGRTPPRHGEEQSLRIEEIELCDGDLEHRLADRFLEACGVPEAEIAAMLPGVERLVREFGGALLRLSWVDGARRFEAYPPPGLESELPRRSAVSRSA